MTLCSLCGLPSKQLLLNEEQRPFCCHGCRAVYNILSAKGELGTYQTHPLFQEALKSGLISNPEVVGQLSSGPCKRLYFEVSDLFCPSCSDFLRLVLERERGVSCCVVDYYTDQAVIEYDPCALGPDALFERVKALGYTPVRSGEEAPGLQRSRLMRCALAGFLTLNIMMLSYPIYASFWTKTPLSVSLLAYLSFLLAVPLLFYCGWPILRRAGSALLVGHVGMEALVSLGAVTAFLLSGLEVWWGSFHLYLDSMGMVISLVLLGRLIESFAKRSSKRTLYRLMRSLPRKGRRVLSDGSHAFCKVSEICVGDRLAVGSGEQVVLDGVVESGSGACDESLMTGEVTPVSKGVGDDVLGGTLLSGGWLVYRVTKSCEEGALRQMIDQIAVDLSRQQRPLRPVDRIARALVPAVFVIALLSGLFAYLSGAPIAPRVLAVLLVSCPCAIGIAGPLAESLLVQRLASRGILVRNRRALRALAEASLVAFDKTGTVTTGRFEVLSGLDGLAADQKSLLKGMASCSLHPVADAVGKALDVAPAPVRDVSEEPGRGLIARGLSGEQLLLGSAALLKEHGIVLPSSNTSCTSCYFAASGMVIAQVLLGDRIREDVPVLECPTALLSGDCEAVVSSVASACHFTMFASSLSPFAKREWILSRQERGERVVFVGDGMNDALALAAADVGISVLRASDMSAQSSDLLLTTDSLRPLEGLIELACFGRRIVRQNLFWAFSYNIVALPIAARGALHPLIAVVAMVLSSLVVVFNATRIGRALSRDHGSRASESLVSGL